MSFCNLRIQSRESRVIEGFKFANCALNCRCDTRANLVPVDCSERDFGASDRLIVNRVSTELCLIPLLDVDALNIIVIILLQHAEHFTSFRVVRVPDYVGVDWHVFREFGV